MTDSESNDELSNTVIRFQNQSTRFHVKGPHINSTVMSGLSFGHNNMLKSTVNGTNHLHVPTNFERPRCAMSWASKSRRDTSPISVTSASGMPRMTQYPGRGFGSQSVYGARAGSPSMSMRSFQTMDSNTSAADIANAIESMKFNKFDLRVIKEALNRQMKMKNRKRVEKRRNARFTKIARRRISGDSGDRASDSSLSDDNKSMQTSRTYRSTASFRSTRTDFQKLNNSNMYKDSLNNFQNSSHMSFYPSSRSCKDTLQKSYMPAYMEDRYSYTSQRERMDGSMISQRNMYQMSSITHDSISTNSTSQKDIYKSKPKSATVTLEERFKIALPAQRTNMFPSQRFKQSSLQSLPSTSTHRQALQSREQDISMARKDISPIRDDRDSFDEEHDIFGENTDIQELGIRKKKRNLNCEDATFPSEKKSKLSPKHTKSTPSKAKDFVFPKPQFPMSRLLKAKNVVKPPKPLQKRVIKSPKQQQKPDTCRNSQDIHTTDLQLEKPSISQPVTEILISKCTQSLDNSAAPKAKSKDTEQQIEIDKDQPVLPEDTTDVSMKPSFIKRKLFSQKVNMPDKNSSSDSIQSASPGANLYSGINKEKHKTRKIVSSQSCLSRDFLGDDSNLLDLIHKIVPPDRMNLTSATNRTEIHSTINNKSKPIDNTVSGTTATKDGDVSDTFTDEEIFAESIVNEKSNNKTVVNTTPNNELGNVNGQQKNTKTDITIMESNNKANFNTKHGHRCNERKDTAGNNEPTYKTKKNKKDTPIKLNKTASVLSKKTKKDTPVNNCLVKKNTISKQKSTMQTSVEKKHEMNEKCNKEMVDQTSIKHQQSVKFKKNDDGNITQPVNHKQSVPKHTNVNKTHTCDSPEENVEFRGFNLNRRRDVLRYWDSDFESDFELERRTPAKPVWGNKSHPISIDKTSAVVKDVTGAVVNDESSVLRSAQNESSKMSDNRQAGVVILDNVLLPANNNPVQNSTEDQSRNNATVITEVSQNMPQVKINCNSKNIREGKANDKENYQPKNAPANKVQQNKPLKNTPPKNQKICKNTNGKKSKVNNNTLRFKSQNQTQTDTLDESSDARYLSLRSRAVDLSLNDSISPIKTGKALSKNNKKDSRAAKNNQKEDSNTVKVHERVGPAKSDVKAESKTAKVASKNLKADISITNTSKHIAKIANKNTKTNSKTVENPVKSSKESEKTDAKKTAASKNNLKKLTSNEQSLLSDLSFTLSAEITSYKKSSKTKPAETLSKTRVSNISFALLKDEPATAPVAAKRSTRSQSNLSNRRETTTSNKSKIMKNETTKPVPIAARRRTRSQSKSNINRDVTITSKNKKSTLSKAITSKPAAITSRNNTKTNSKANLNVSREVLTLLSMSPRFFATSSKRMPSKPRRFVAQD